MCVTKQPMKPQRLRCSRVANPSYSVKNGRLVTAIFVDGLVVRSEARYR